MKKTYVKSIKTNAMIDQKMTSIFFSERNFLAIVEAVQSWTYKTYRYRIDNVYNEVILQTMKNIFRKRKAMTEETDVDDYVLMINKQVLREILEAISIEVKSYREPDRLTSAEQFHNEVREEAPRKGFMLGNDHIIPKTNQTSLPTEDPGGENNTMERYEKESKRRQKEIVANSDVNTSMVSGMSLPTIMEGQEEDDASLPEFLEAFEAGSELLPPLVVSQPHKPLPVSDQAISHIQAIQQQPRVRDRDEVSRPIITPNREQSPGGSDGTTSDGRPNLSPLQADLQNLIRRMDTVLEILQNEKKVNQVTAETANKKGVKRTNVFSSASRDIESYSSINRFGLYLENDAFATKMLLPRHTYTMPYIKVCLNNETRIVNVENYSQDFLKAEIMCPIEKSTEMTISDLNDKALYPNDFDVVKVSSIQFHESHMLVETRLHCLREGDTIRFVDVECEDEDLRRELNRAQGYTVSVVDHVHFIVTEMARRKPDRVFLSLGSFMKMKQQSMPSANILVVCSELSHTQMYVIDLINVLIGEGRMVHIIQQNQVDERQGGVIEQRSLPSNNIIRGDREKLRLYSLKSTDQSSLNQMIREVGCRVVIFVCKDGENRFTIDSKLPVLSIFVLLLNYANIPKKTRKIIKFFDIIIGTGEHSMKCLGSMNLGKPTSLIGPKLLKRSFDLTNTSSAKMALGLNPNRFVFLLDVNDNPEIKSVDTVIQAYAGCQKNVPGFKEKAMLLINASPTIQLVNILKLENFTPEEVSVHIQYYSNGLERNETLLNHIVASADTVINMSGGSDMDTHLFLAQEYKKLVIYRDCETTRRYCLYGIPVKKQQIYLDGLAQGLLHLPSVEKLAEAMHMVLDRFHKFSMSGTMTGDLAKLRNKYDRFERDWLTYLESL